MLRDQWSSIIGHGRQVDQLKKALASGRMPGAWLFAGPRGVGKRRVADVLALAIVCETPSRDDGGCGSCGACRKAASRNHPDLFVVEPESEQETRDPESREQGRSKPSELLKVDQIRELQARLQFHPLEAKAKLAIIDEADRMSESTANSLLKILEEPPTATHFVLISTAPHAILPTIRSRAARLDFGPIPDEEIAEVLIRKNRMTRAEAERIARLACGSLGTAQAIDPAFLEEVLGRFLALVKTGSSADVIATAEEWSRNDQRRLRLTFDLLASFYRDCLRFLATGDTSRLIHPESAEASRTMGAARAFGSLAEIAAARRAIDTTANKQLMFEHLLFSLAG